MCTGVAPPAGQACVPMFVSLTVTDCVWLTAQARGALPRSYVAAHSGETVIAFDGDDAGPMPTRLPALTVKV